MIQTDPFRDLDTLFGRLSGRQGASGGVMPMDAFRRGSDVWVYIDLPGVKAENLDITVERNMLTVSAERNWQREDGDQAYFGERYRGRFRRQIELGDSLDLEHLEADLHDGVLTVRIPVVDVEVPGIQRGEIDVEISGRRLTVRGERKDKQRTGILRRRERVVGTFACDVTLPGEIVEDDVTAELTDGVLNIRLPKHPNERPRHIPIT